MDVGEFSGHRLYTGLTLDYRLRLWAPTSTLHTICSVAELIVLLWMFILVSKPKPKLS